MLSLMSRFRPNESFQTALTQKPILRLPNFEKQFVLQTDASDSGLGAVLLQEHDGVNMPVMYISRKLNAAETHYSTIERECLGVVLGDQAITCLLVWNRVYSRN